MLAVLADVRDALVQTANASDDEAFERLAVLTADVLDAIDDLA